MLDIAIHEITKIIIGIKEELNPTTALANSALQLVEVHLEI